MNPVAVHHDPRTASVGLFLDPSIMSDITPTPLDRYSRQMRVPGIGKAGQERILASRVTLCGVGALGTVLANTLVRSGVGFVRIVDRDFVEPLRPVDERSQVRAVGFHGGWAQPQSAIRCLLYSRSHRCKYSR